jgi:hypothetical protein
VLGDVTEWTCPNVNESGEKCGYHTPHKFTVCPRCRRDATGCTLQQHPNAVKAIVLNLAKAGLSQAFIARQVMPGLVSEDTITREKRRDRAFADAIDNGRSSAIAFCMTKLIQNVGHGNQGAIEFYLANSIAWGTERALNDPAAGGTTVVKFNVDPSRILSAAKPKKTEKKPQTKGV